MFSMNTHRTFATIVHLGLVLFQSKAKMCSCSTSSHQAGSAAVNNHQLPSYMTGFLYPLGNTRGVYSFVRSELYLYLRRLENFNVPGEDSCHRLCDSISVKRILCTHTLKRY